VNFQTKTENKILIFGKKRPLSPEKPFPVSPTQKTRNSESAVLTAIFSKYILESSPGNGNLQGILTFFGIADGFF